MKTRNRFTTTLIILGLLGITAALAAGVLRKVQLNTSSQDFVVELTPQILNGQPEILAQHATTQLLQEQPLPTLTRSLNIVTLNMGAPKVIQSISGGTVVPLWYFSSTQPTAEYTLEVEFAGGTGQVEALLQYQNESWLFSGFTVIADQLAQ